MVFLPTLYVMGSALQIRSSAKFIDCKFIIRYFVQTYILYRELASFFSQLFALLLINRDERFWVKLSNASASHCVMCLLSVCVCVFCAKTMLQHCVLVVWLKQSKPHRFAVRLTDLSLVSYNIFELFSNGIYVH